MRLDTLDAQDLPVAVGRYTLQALLGEGGMARVFRAEMMGDLGFRKAAAVKVILAGTGARAASLKQQLIQEARLGALLNHPNVVQTFDCGQLAGFPYIAMELVTGVGLGELVEGHGPLPAGVVLDIGAQVARGLHHAHSLIHEGKPFPIVHRDIKPSNILVRSDGIVKVLDFGIAKAYGDDAQLTSTGMTKGTPAYMSPEQLAAEPLDGRSDLFALGAVLYYLATGKTLFQGQSITEIMMRIVQVDDVLQGHGGLEEAGRAVPGLDGVLRGLLVKNRAARYPDGEQLARAVLDLRPRCADGPSAVEVVRGRAGARVAALERTPPAVPAKPLVSTLEETAPVNAPPERRGSEPRPKSRKAAPAPVDATRLLGPGAEEDLDVGPQPRPKPGLWWGAVAALVVVGVGVGGWWLGRGSGGPQVQPVDGQDSGTPGSNGPAAPLALTPADEGRTAAGPTPAPRPDRKLAESRSVDGASDMFLAAAEPAGAPKEGDRNPGRDRPEDGASDMFLADSGSVAAPAAEALAPPSEMSRRGGGDRLPIFAAAPTAGAGTRESPTPTAAPAPKGSTSTPASSATAEPVLKLRHQAVSAADMDGTVTFVVEGEAPSDALVVVHWGRKGGDHEVISLRPTDGGRWEGRARAEGGGEFEYWIVASHPKAVPSRQAFGRAFQPFVVRAP